MLNEQVSVIIPTLQKDTRILQALISILEADDAVSEIIIINNAVHPFEPELTGNKINIYTPPENMYVNKSWNYGVAAAKNDIFLIINDDIICCDNFCSVILLTGIFERETTGLVGIDNDYLRNYSKDRITERFFSINNKYTYADVTLNRLDSYKKLGDWGSAFMGRKAAYHNIPEKYKIIYGDNHLLKKNMEEGKINYKMSGISFNHLHSLTSFSQEFWPVCMQDYNAADDDFRNNNR